MDKAYNSITHMVIPKPVADAGEAVMVRNNRNDKWERGVLQRAHYGYSWGVGDYEWSYGVVLDRRSTSDTSMYSGGGPDDVMTLAQFEKAVG